MERYVISDLELYNVRTDAWGLLSLAAVLLVLSSAIPWPNINKLAEGNLTTSQGSGAAGTTQKPKIAPSIANSLVLITVLHHILTGYGCWQHYKLETHYNTSMGIGVWANAFLTIAGLSTILLGNSGQADKLPAQSQKKAA